MDMNSEKVAKPFKRLVVGCDGTWMNSDSAFEPSPSHPGQKPAIGRILEPSNVTRLCRAIRPTSMRESRIIPQIICYQPGIGTEGGWWDHYFNGATGFSLAENVREAYGFLCANYEENDEIIILGFSRGAFTARSIGALIQQVGLLTVEGMEDFYNIFKDWEEQDLGQTFEFRGVKGLQWEPENSTQKSSYTECLESYKLTRPDIMIKAIACFDTVGALGIPTLPWVERIKQSLPFTWLHRPMPYSFVDQKVLSNVENCFQALALDEHRRAFTPTLWEIPDALVSKVNLKQCWFPGVHSNIGGSLEDAELANISLAWMVSQLDGILEFDSTNLQFVQELNEKYYEQHKNRKPVWSEGYITETYAKIYTVDGSTTRTPGQYHRTDPLTGKPLEAKLRHTNESIHPSVRVRQALGARGPNDIGPYRPPALKNFELVSAADPDTPVKMTSDPLLTGLAYVLRDRESRQGEQPTVMVPEEVLHDVEVDFYLKNAL